jgi:hypothetical protein
MLDENDPDVTFLRNLHFLSVEDALIELQKYKERIVLETRYEMQKYNPVMP